VAGAGVFGLIESAQRAGQNIWRWSNSMILNSEGGSLFMRRVESAGCGEIARYFVRPDSMWNLRAKVDGSSNQGTNYVS
jgi:hypothetical protein